MRCMITLRITWLLIGLGVLTSHDLVFAQAARHVPSKPNTVVWGEIPIDRAPVLTIDSGETVAIDTISHQGATQDADPVEFLDKLGIAKNEVLQDAIDFWQSRTGRPREGRGRVRMTLPDRGEPNPQGSRAAEADPERRERLTRRGRYRRGR